jgi:hypothetical protein
LEGEVTDLPLMWSAVVYCGMGRRLIPLAVWMV